MPDADGRPCFSAGGFGAVFKTNTGDGYKALKCFTRAQEGRRERYAAMKRLFCFQEPKGLPGWQGAGLTETCGSNPQGNRYVLGFELLSDEMTVFSDEGIPASYDVLLMEWAEGRSLAIAIGEAALAGNRRELRGLSARFDALALWLLRQSWAHGDLKPENIIVRSDGTLVLIDYDDLWLPSMPFSATPVPPAGNGSEGYRHPLVASGLSVGAYADDYPAAVISLSIRALAEYPELYGRYHDSDRIIFDPEALLAGRCKACNFLKTTSLVSSPLLRMIESHTPRLGWRLRTELVGRP